MNFKLAIDSAVTLAETPVWDGRIGRLYWTDLFTGDIHQYDPATGKETGKWATGKLIGSAVPCEELGKLLCVVEDGAYILDQATGKMEHLCDAEPGNGANRYNDSRVDAAGRIFMSTVAKTYGTDDYTPDQLGGFYMLDTDHKTVKTVVEGINQYNAIVWNKDNSKMFVVDTYNETLLAFDYDLAKGPISGPKVVVDFKGKQGMPDGMSIDEEDNLYICHWSGKISVWNKKMELAEEIAFPVEQVCCTGFGGEDMKDLYVATARYCYGEEELAKNPGAGGTFVGKAGVKGRPDHFFK